MTLSVTSRIIVASVEMSRKLVYCPYRVRLSFTPLCDRSHLLVICPVITIFLLTGPFYTASVYNDAPNISTFQSTRAQGIGFNFRAYPNHSLDRMG